jgi:hypothetical protein
MIFKRPGVEILFVLGQAHNRHHFARDGDDETILADDAVLSPWATVISRRARSFISIARFQTIRFGSMLRDCLDKSSYR